MAYVLENRSVTVAVIIPCYKVEGFIREVLASLPAMVDFIIPVDDCSPDATGRLLDEAAQGDARIRVIHHSQNQGVGGSMRSGFREALRLSADVAVKLDGDGQMDVRYLEKMVAMLASSPAYDFVKGNRFHDRGRIGDMPVIRRIGNMGMSFLIKMASGYWNISDPANGYFAIRTSTLAQLPLERLSPRFFFESSLIIELYYTGAKIKDLAMPAIYGQEKSNLSVCKTLLTFPWKLQKAFLRRILLRYFICDFNISSVYILTGLPLFLFGAVFGLCKWIHYAGLHTPTPTGTIMISVLSIVLGFQMLLASIQYDITAGNPFEKEE
ncbi:MAG: glycosyltransferase family 2 protein [Bacteroidales bacterium]|nr:glycosyltransferase family 2 protein [Bacteroidales bacterium]